MNAPPTESSPRRKRRWPRILLAVVLLLVAYGIYRYTLHRMVEAKLDAIRKEGYPTTLSEVDAWLGQPMPVENAAAIYTNALSGPDPWENDKRKFLPLVGTNRFPARTERMTDNLKLSIEAYLSDNAERLKLLHKAGQMDESRYSVDVSKWPPPIPYLSPSRQATRLLSLEAVYRAESGDAEAAAESLVACVGVGNSLKQEPWLISQLVRIAINSMSISSLEQVVNRMELTNSQIKEVDASLSVAEDIEHMYRAMVVQRAYGSDSFDHIDHEIEMTKKFGDKRSVFFDPDEFFSIRSRFQLFLYRASGLLDQERICQLDLMRDCIRLVRLPLPERLKATKAWDAKVKGLPVYRVRTKMLSSFSFAIEKDVRNLTSVRVARLALAVERFRLGQGLLPDSIEQLVPSYLPEVPSDPYDGKSIRYKKMPKGYVVYSIGEDGQDDGGTEKTVSGQSFRPGTDITFTVER